MTVVRESPQLTPLDQAPAWNRIISAFAWRSNLTDIALASASAEIDRLTHEVAEWEKVWDSWEVAS